MNRYFMLTVIIFFMSYKLFADEVAQKTDSAFVGENPKTINSLFVGDISNSMANDVFRDQDIGNNTDGVFVGSNTIKTQYNYFAGDGYQQQVGNSTLGAFAEDSSKKAKDSVFIGQDIRQKTDGVFVGANYGK